MLKKGIQNLFTELIQRDQLNGKEMYIHKIMVKNVEMRVRITKIYLPAYYKTLKFMITIFGLETKIVHIREHIAAFLFV